MKLMKMKINIEKCLIIYFLTAALLSGYIEQFAIWNIVSILMFAVAIVACNGNRLLKKTPEIVMELIVLLVFVLVSLINSIETLKYAAANIRSFSYSICVILVFLIIQIKSPDLIINFLIYHIRFFNLWLITNLVILSQQVNKNFIFIKDTWFQQNSYYRDHCDGLFGANSTDIMGFYIIFVLLLNIMFARKRTCTRQSIFWYTYTVVLAILSLTLYSKNDGAALFVLMPVAIIYQIWISTNTKQFHINYSRVLKIIILCIVILFLLFSIKPVQEFFINKVVMKLETTIGFARTDAEINGSNERIAIAAAGLSNGWGWYLGKGIGYVKWHAQKAFGFNHFGISSIGAFINLVGIWFYLVLCTLYSSVWYRISETCSIKTKMNIRYLMLFLNVIAMTVFTYIFTEIRTNILLILIVIVLYNSSPENRKKVIKKEIIYNED